MDECLEMMDRIWDLVERSVLEEVAAGAIAHGFNADDVCREIETYAHKLAALRADRLATARLMLEAGATSLQ